MSRPCASILIPWGSTILGDCLGETGRVTEAIKEYEQALRLKPDFTEAQVALARLRAKQGRIDGAITQVLRFGSVW